MFIDKTITIIFKIFTFNYVTFLMLFPFFVIIVFLLQGLNGVYEVLIKEKHWAYKYYVEARKDIWSRK